MLTTTSRCVVALLLTFAPPVAWFLVNIGSSTLTSNVFDDAAGPFWYVASIVLTSAIVATIALAIRRRDGAALAGLWVLTAVAAAINATIAIAVAIPRPGPALEVNAVNNLTRFTRIYYNRAGVNSLGHAEAVERRSWRFDEYGLRPASSGGSSRAFLVLWEEYGLPFRCVISPMGLDVDNHGADVLRGIQVHPVAFTGNTLIITMMMLGCRLPWWIVERHRRQDGRCTTCGYRLAGLPRCPECGSAVQSKAA